MPNLSVGVNSWLRSACYPRRTFYPLSDGPSMRNHRITKSWFPTCSTCMSRSQARLCLRTLWLISKQRANLRAPPLQFRRRPPQSNYQPSSVPDLDNRTRLERRSSKGGISPLAPPRPRSRVQSLPPILRILRQHSLLGCSKGARGLFVL